MARIHETLSGQSIKYDEPSPKLERFLKRVQALVDDPKATENDVIALVYGRENPILDQTIFPERGAVTKAVIELPVYGVLTDLLARKHLQASGISPEKLGAKFTISVADAASRKGVSEDSIRKAIRERKVPAWLRRGEYFLEPSSLEAAAIGRAQTLKPLDYSIGYDGERKAFLKLRVDPGGEIIPKGDKPVPRSGVVKAWKRGAVLTAGNDGKARYFEIVPGGETADITFHDFHVRGAFSIEKKINNPREARQAWEAFSG